MDDCKMTVGMSETTEEDHVTLSATAADLKADTLHSSWQEFLASCEKYENVRIICSDGVYLTHKILVIHKLFLKYLLVTQDVDSKAVILLPDFTVDQIKTVLSPFPTQDASSRIQEDPKHELELDQLLTKCLEDINDVQKNNNQNQILVSNAYTIKEDTNPEKSCEIRKIKSVKRFYDDLNDFIDDDDTDPDDDGLQDEDEFPIVSKPKKKKTGASKIKRKKRKDPKPGEERSFQCKECGRGYNSVKYLECHITKYHPEESSLNEFMTKEKSGILKCQLCDKVFTVARSLRYHLKIKHKIGAEFSCDICKKLFYYEYELETHRKCHVGERTFKCDLCDKGFLQEKNLIQHKASMHSTREEKEKNRTFVCSKCGKGFFSKGALQEHEFLHSDLKQFSCNVCGKLFKQASGLRAHTNRYHSTNGPKVRTEEEKERMRNYMKKYRAMKLGKIPDVINHRYAESSELGNENMNQKETDPLATLDARPRTLGLETSVNGGEGTTALVQTEEQYSTHLLYYKDHVIL
eukprot:TRINITY_DN22455_c0_g1_i1.p1 TRINITY_DN22455_c0_g1~~TRINITY_DN22455_c0_g1_i1.p1  ORF type:complete len:521 (+),score=78.26 TRINITY_DN22455_c0_g1_i1:54-1616(+)